MEHYNSYLAVLDSGAPSVGVASASPATIAARKECDGFTDGVSAAPTFDDLDPHTRAAVATLTKRKATKHVQATNAKALKRKPAAAELAESVPKASGEAVGKGLAKAAKPKADAKRLISRRLPRQPKQKCFTF